MLRAFFIGCTALICLSFYKDSRSGAAKTLWIFLLIILVLILLIF